MPGGPTRHSGATPPSRPGSPPSPAARPSIFSAARSAGEPRPRSPTPTLPPSTRPLSGEIGSTFAAPDFSFEVREHVAYCFACVGRSLPPDEQAALVLGDVADMSARDAARVLGVSKSVFRHRLAAARQAMRDRVREPLRARLQDRHVPPVQGAARERRRRPPRRADTGRGGLRRPAGGGPRAPSFAEGKAVALHDIFWRRTREIEATGLGSTAPETELRGRLRSRSPPALLRGGGGTPKRSASSRH